MIDQGVRQRFGRNGNGAEVEYSSATREGSRRYGRAAELDAGAATETAIFLLPCLLLGVGEGEVECRVQSAAGGVQR